MLPFAAFALFLVHTTAAQSLHACKSQISNPAFNLIREEKIGRWVQCEYQRQEPEGTSGKYCFYNQDYSLAHYPNTPLPVDSSPDCPDPLPLASTYLLKPSDALPGKCVTAASNSDGAAVTIQDCDYRHGNPSQTWTFQNSQLRMFGNKCLDVKDGSTANGAKLQIWTCFDGNPNQQFVHSGGDVLTLPIDRISWQAHQGKCVDLPNGNQNNGNQLQMWDCGANNPNQAWFVSIVPG